MGYSFKRLKKSYRGRKKGEVFKSSTKQKQNPIKEQFLREHLRKPCKILFVCSANMQRSPAAENLTKNIRGLKVKSAGLWAMEGFVEGSTQLTTRHLEWADKIFVMEPQHKKVITKHVPSVKKKIVVLHVPDIYPSKDSRKLERILRNRLKDYIPELH